MAALDEVASLQKLQLLELEDAAVVTMNQKGKVKVALEHDDIKAAAEDAMDLEDET
jgi:uncharacterized membrane protein